MSICLTWLACCICYGDTIDIESVKAFISTPPENLLLRFTSERTVPGGASLKTLHTNSQFQAVESGKPIRTYYQLLLDSTNYSVVRSLIPLEFGPEENSQFLGKGRLASEIWGYIGGQIQYSHGTSDRSKGRNDPDQRENEAYDFSGYHDVETMLNLGIDAKTTSVTWSGNGFEGEQSPSWPRGRGGRGLGSITNHLLNSDRIYGEMVVSNGLPFIVRYRDGMRSGVVHYAYDRHLETPIPSEIRIDHFAIFGNPATTNFLYVDTFQVTEARISLTSEDKAMLKPDYLVKLGASFLGKANSDQMNLLTNAVHEVNATAVVNPIKPRTVLTLRLSNDVVVAALPGDAWKAVHPRQLPPGKVTFFSIWLMLVMAAGPLTLILMMRRTARKRGQPPPAPDKG